MVDPSLVELGFHIGTFNSQDPRRMVWIGLLVMLGYDNHNKRINDWYKSQN